jgi:hypothetical protein
LPWTTVAHRHTWYDHTRNTVHGVGQHQVLVRASVRVLAHLSAWVDVVLVVAVGRRCDLVVCCWVVHKVQVDGRFRPIVQKLCNWPREGGAPVRLLEGGGTCGLWWVFKGRILRLLLATGCILGKHCTPHAFLWLAIGRNNGLQIALPRVSTPTLDRVCANVGQYNTLLLSARCPL